MTISDRIELLREKNGISLTHLNSKIGAYRGKLTEVRKGKTTLNKEELAVLAEALSTSTDYLLGNTDDPRPAGQKESSPFCGELVGPNKRALLDLVETMSDEEMGDLLEVVKATLKMRDKK